MHTPPLSDRIRARKGPFLVENGPIPVENGPIPAGGGPIPPGVDAEIPFAPRAEGFRADPPGEPGDLCIFEIRAGEPRGRPPRIAIRVTDRAYGWVEGLAAHCSLSLTDVVWQSLLRMADASGYHLRVPARFRSRNHSRRRLDLARELPEPGPDPEAGPTRPSRVY